MPKTSVSRRLFLSMAAAAAFGFRQRSNESSRFEMIVRSRRPEDLEMPAAGFSDFITPVDHFFVRSHVSVPTVDVASWRLQVDGNVSGPLTLSMPDLRSMPSAELVAVLECAGNGRSFHDPTVAGIQWTNGAVGNGRWRGVRLADVLKRAGVKEGTVEILFDGADVPIGSMADFQRSIPLAKALLPDTLLAYDMNGEQLPVKHGFPLRVIVPGWAGDSWIKWVTNIRVLKEPATGFWMKNAYVQPVRPVAPGTTVPPEAMTPVTSLRVKSVISFPASSTSLAVGKPVVIRGAAWSGDGGSVQEVSVSVDRGRTWRPARLTSPATRFGWRLWEYAWTPSTEGRHVLLARARDSKGDVQPLVAEWNPSGYLWNAVARADVNVGGAAETASVSGSTAQNEPPASILQRCLVCHDADVIRQQRLTRAQWNRELDKMINWGARVTPEDREPLIEYLLRLADPRR
jgi:DMSO/TMAO reductase YedYZ molybdopterin-dependent catalytic subunit